MRHLMILGLCVLGGACESHPGGAPTAPTHALIGATAQSPAQQGRGAPVEVTFTKWVTAYPMMEGFTGGDVVGTYAGEVLSRTAFDNGVIVELEARYEVIDPGGAHSFTTHLRGTQNTKTGSAVLNGIVTEGWLTGAQVHVTFDVITPCEFGTGNVCFQGTIRLMPGSGD